MTTDNWNLLTNALMVVVIVGLWLGRRHERRQAIENEAAMRARCDQARIRQDGSVRGRP